MGWDTVSDPWVPGSNASPPPDLTTGDNTTSSTQVSADPQAMAPATDPQALASNVNSPAMAPAADSQPIAPAADPQSVAPAADPQSVAPDVTPQAIEPAAVPEVTIIEEPEEVTFVHEVVPEISTCVMLNGKVFSMPIQATLRKNNPKLSPVAFAMPTFEQDCFRGQLTLVWHGTRRFDEPGTKPSEKMNPKGTAKHTLRIDISAMDINDFSIVDATKNGLPAAFCAQTTNPEGANYVDLEGKFFVIFYATKIRATGTQIPAMDTTNCKNALQSLSREINTTKIKKGNFNFFLIIDNDAHKRKLFGKLHHKILSDKLGDPLKMWIKDSPVKQLLEIGNILKPYEFPPVSREGWIIANKATWQDKLEAHVHNIYATTIEHNYFKGCRTEWNATKFEASFAALPGTSFANNSFDNSMPKMYLLHVHWEGQKLDRPKPGDTVHVRLPFSVPACPKYEGPNPRRQRADPNDFNDDGTFREDSDEEPMNEAQWRKQLSDEAKAEEEQRQLQTWMGIVQTVDKYTPPNSLPVIIFRRTDFRYLGPQGSERRVDTEVPSHKVNFRNLDRLKTEFQMAPKYSVTVEPSFSDRTYKDVVRNLNEFFKLDEANATTTANAHVAQYFLAYDDTLQFPAIDFFKTYAPSDWEQMCAASLSDRQKDALKAAASNIRHAYLRILGVVASAKSRVCIMMVMLMLAKNIKAGRPHHKNALLIQETNVGVDDLAINLAHALEEQKVEATIIRLGSLPTENSKFNAKFLAPHFLENFHDDGKETEMFIATRYLYDAANSADQSRKSGDKRFSPSVKNLTLYEAMWRKVNAEHDTNLAYNALLEKVDYIEKNPEDETFDWAQLRALRKVLLNDTLLAADAVVATSGQALRTTAQKAVPAYTMIVLDEGGKRTPATTCAVVGAYTFDFLVENGDNIQMGPVFKTARNPSFWNMFYQSQVRTILEGSGESSLDGMFLDEQFRMYTPQLTNYINYTFYHGQLIDATKNTPESSNVKFFRELFKKKFGIDSNIVVVLVRNSKSQVESGGTSIFNVATQYVVTELMKEARDMIDKKACGVEQNLTLAAISPYKAEATMIQTEINASRLQNCDSLVSEVVQGITRNGVFLSLPNSKCLSGFGTQGDRYLVEISRHREGFALIIPEGALDHENYQLQNEGDMYNHRIRNIKMLTEMAKIHGFLTVIEAPDESECFKCGQKGHSKQDCYADSEHQLPKKCWNCSERGHNASDCPDEITEALRPAIRKDEAGNNLNGKTCSRCGSSKHLKFEISGCKKCNSCEHRGDECPEKECRICKVKGHLALSCPKRLPCKKCGGDHSNRDCNAPKPLDTRRNLSRYPTKSTFAVPVETMDLEPEVDSQGFSVNETKSTLQFSIISASSLLGIPESDLQEQMMIDYAIARSLVTAGDAHVGDIARTAAETPKVSQRLEIIDMSVYHSPRSTEAFAAKEKMIEGIFTIPARKEGELSWPFGNEMVVQLPGGHFVMGNQWEDPATGKQYITWYEKVPYSTFSPDKIKGYTYVPDFDVVSITPAALFEDRPVTQTAECESEAESGGWGNESVHEGQSEEVSGAVNSVVSLEEVKVEQGNVWKGEASGNVEQAGLGTAATAKKNDNNGWGEATSSWNNW
jgi:hypothetical protein